MKLRAKTNQEICNENKLPYTVLTNVVEEEYSKNKMRATSNLIAKALSATLGPYGSSTIIQDREQRHFATKDGYDLMNRMMFDDEVSRTILDLFRTTASNQVLTVGDGSTSAIIVANSLFQTLTDKNQIDHLKKIAPQDIISILNDISNIVEEKLKKLAMPISDDMHELDIIAAIANNNETKTGKVIADIYREIGENGFISMDVLERKEEDAYELKSGIEWNRGFVDPLFEKFSNNGVITYEAAPKIIISNSTLTYDDLELVIMPLMKEALNQENSELLIVANDFDEDVITFFKNNRTKHLQIGSRAVPMNFVVSDIDTITKKSRNKIEDLALLCDCKIYDKILTQKADIIAHPKDYVGTAGKIIVTKKTTQVIARDYSLRDAKHNKKIDTIVKEYKNKINKLKEVEEPTREQDFELDELSNRISHLTTSTAILHVGGKTLAERMTRQRLIEDAIFACKSAIKYGYIPGGNICIPKILKENKEEIAKFLGSKYDYLPITGRRIFFDYFIDVVADAFLESYKNVLNNSYMSEDEIDKTIKKCLEENKFYNLKLHKFEDMDKTVVINSVDTDIQILRSCISIVSILATSNQFMTINFSINDQIKK